MANLGVIGVGHITGRLAAERPSAYATATYGSHGLVLWYRPPATTTYVTLQGGRISVL